MRQLVGNQCKTKNNTLASKSIKKILWDQRYLIILLIPCLVYYIIFCYVPMYGLIIAFKNFDISLGYWGSPWVGLKYFQDFLYGPYLLRLIRNTFVISFSSLIFGFPIPIMFALFVNELKNKHYKKLVQTVSYLPHFVSLVIVMGIMRQIFSQDTGVINKIITATGGTPINFFMQKEWFVSIFVGSGIWQGFGWNSIIYLAAMSSIDTQLYDAAKIDGAGRFTRMWHVTLQGIKPTIMTLLVLNMGSLLNVGYEKIILMYNPATYETADVISTYVFRAGLQGGNYSFGTAVGLLNSLIAIIFLVSANYLSNKFTETSLW